MYILRSCVGFLFWFVGCHLNSTSRRAPTNNTREETDRERESRRRRRRFKVASRAQPAFRAGCLPFSIPPFAYQIAVDISAAISRGGGPPEHKLCRHRLTDCICVTDPESECNVRRIVCHFGTQGMIRWDRTGETRAH